LRRGRVDPEGHFVIGRVGVGVVVRTGNPEPDIGSLERFKESVLAADAVVYNEASTGLYLDKLFELLGIAEQIKPRTTRVASGEEVFERVVNGRGYEIGFGAMTAIRLFEPRGGLKYVGPLPEQIQNRTAYVAGVMIEAPAEDAAKEFLRYLGTPAAKAVFTAVGIE
jgi:molybdate transport system substrate-binding protein